MLSTVASSIRKAATCAFAAKPGDAVRMPASASAADENRTVVFMRCSSRRYAFAGEAFVAVA